MLSLHLALPWEKQLDEPTTLLPRRGDRPRITPLGTLTELFEVLSRKQFRGYIDEEDMRRFLAVLTREAQWIDVDVQITACRDPKDDKFLSLAVSGQATHIVTGDADLLALHPFREFGSLRLAPSWRRNSCQQAASSKY